MGSFATLSLNSIFGLADVEAVDRFRDEFPHLYLPRKAYFLDGHHTVFKEMSINVIVQHWLVGNTFVYADNLKNEFRGKEMICPRQFVKDMEVQTSGNLKQPVWTRNLQRCGINLFPRQEMRLRLTRDLKPKSMVKWASSITRAWTKQKRELKSTRMKI